MATIYHMSYKLFQKTSTKIPAQRVVITGYGHLTVYDGTNIENKFQYQNAFASVPYTT